MLRNLFLAIMAIVLSVAIVSTDNSAEAEFGGINSGYELLVAAEGHSRTDKVQGMAEAINLNSGLNARKRMSRIQLTLNAVKEEARRIMYIRKTWKPKTGSTPKRYMKDRAARHAAYLEKISKMSYDREVVAYLKSSNKSAKRAEREARKETNNAWLDTHPAVPRPTESRAKELLQLRESILKRSNLESAAKKTEAEAKKNKSRKEAAKKYREYMDVFSKQLKWQRNRRMKVLTAATWAKNYVHHEEWLDAGGWFFHATREDAWFTLGDFTFGDLKKIAEINNVPVGIVVASAKKYNLGWHNKEAVRKTMLQNAALYGVAV